MAYWTQFSIPALLNPMINKMGDRRCLAYTCACACAGILTCLHMCVCSCLCLLGLTDPRSSLAETKSSQKESSFPTEMPLIKYIGAANLQSPVTARKSLPECHRKTRLGCVLTNVINTPLHGSFSCCL